MYNKKLYTKNGSYPSRKPDKLQMPDGSFKTSSTLTHEDMLELGWTVAPDYPTPDDSSNTANWPVYDWNANTSSWTLKY